MERKIINIVKGFKTEDVAVLALGILIIAILFWIKRKELPPKFIDGLAEHYIMEYENIEDEKLITLMVVALNILMSN